MTILDTMNKLHNAVMDVLRWHYFKVEYARAWDEPVCQAGITDHSLLTTLESYITEQGLCRLKREGKAWAEYQMFSSKPEAEWTDVAGYIYPKEHLELQHG